MSYHKEEQDIYYIPPNFLTSGRLFGGMIRVRNAIEACVLVLLTGLPIIRLPLSLTARIILLCLIPLPLGIFAVIGFDGDSLTEFALNWIKWLFNRRILRFVAEIGNALFSQGIILAIPEDIVHIQSGLVL